LLIASLSSKQAFSTWIFGIANRNFGFLTYFFLVCVMLIAIIISKKNAILNLLKVLILTGVISCLYGLIQYYGLDPFLWINRNSPVFGVFGNPNFQSSFMGITGTASVAFLLSTKINFKLKIVLFSYLPLALFVISKSKSQQGFLVFFAGISTVFFIWMKSNRIFKRLSSFYIISLIAGWAAVLLDIFQKAPWPSILFKESVSYRGDFWRAGLKMSIENPVFGVGPGGFVDNFRIYRDSVSAGRSGSSNVDSAHNVLLDISSIGGIPLLLIFIVLNVFVLLAALKLIRRSITFDYAFAGIFGTWIAYTAQSLISINQLGISIWGWVLSGAIVGYEINTRPSQGFGLPSNDAFEVLSISGGIALSLIISLPLVLSDARFRESVRSGDVNKIVKVVETWPKNTQNMNFVSSLLRQGGFLEQSLYITRKAVDFNPNSFESWQQLYFSPNATDFEINSAIKKMRELDPLNTSIK
jgi:O-antigen ligase